MQNSYNVWSHPTFYQCNSRPWQGNAPPMQHDNYNPVNTQAWPQYHQQHYQHPQSYAAPSDVYYHREFVPFIQQFPNYVPNHVENNGRYQHHHNASHYRPRPYDKNDRRKEYNSNSLKNKNNFSSHCKNINKKQENNKNKKNVAEDFLFNCDICDRGFKTEQVYKEHIDNHEKCPKENCNYFAAPKLVKMHIKMHHDTGLAKKIWNIESREEIEKWIAERKRNFPTAANISKKKSIVDDKITRGEVLHSKSFHHRPHMPRGKHRYGQAKHLKKDFTKDQSDHSSNIKKTVDMDNSNSESALNQHLSSLDLLVDNYNSDNSDQNENTAPVKKKHAKLSKLPAFPKPPWESRVFLRTRPTLLEKLLSKEIRHERNIILQCTRYIVENNFFSK